MPIELMKWLASLPAEKRVKETAIAEANMDRISRHMEKSDVHIQNK